MHRREFVSKLAVAGSAVAASSVLVRAEATPGAARHAFLARDFGALANGTARDTKALQAAIDACAAAGGGTVTLTAGTYLSGTLLLRSQVTLHLEAGATLLGSKTLEDYPPTVPARRSYTDNYTERSLIYGENLERVSITGAGRIDGQGAAFKGPYKVRPYLLRLIDCRGVAVRQVTLQNPAMWTQHYLACDDLLLDGLTVRSQVNLNNDGMDIDGCQNVRIANCDIRSGDDAIVLKSTLDRSCRNVAISNCLLSSDCNAFKLGTESNGGFENITLSNCVIYDTRLAGLAVEMVDGGVLERVSLAHVVMQNVKCPVFVRLGNRARPFQTNMQKPGLGRLRHVRIAHVQADGADRIGCSITGLPERNVEDVALENIRIGFAGGGNEADGRRNVPERGEAYPEYNMFGALPAYGFYCRHATGLRFEHVVVGCTAPDARPSLVCDDVDDLEVQDWRAAKSAASSPEILCNNVRGAVFRGCHGPIGGKPFLRLEGGETADIRLVGNDLADPTTAVVRGEGVPVNVVRIK